MTDSYYGKGLELVDSEDFEQAGDYFTQAAYQALAHSSLQGSEHQIGSGLEALLQAAFSYCRAGAYDRRDNRCQQGILITKDLQDNVIEDDELQAVLQEYIADFNGIGQFDEEAKAYQNTLDRLAAANAEYSTSLHSSPIADSIIGFTLHLAQFVERDPDIELIYDFAGRVAFKRDEMKTIVQSVSSSSE